MLPKILVSDSPFGFLPPSAWENYILQNLKNPRLYFLRHRTPPKVFPVTEV